MNRAAIMREAHRHWRYAHAEAARAAGKSLALPAIERRLRAKMRPRPARCEPQQGHFPRVNPPRVGKTTGGGERSGDDDFRLGGCGCLTTRLRNPKSVIYDSRGKPARVEPGKSASSPVLRGTDGTSQEPRSNGALSGTGDAAFMAMASTVFAFGFFICVRLTRLTVGQPPPLG